MRAHIISNTLRSIERGFNHALEGKIAGAPSNLFVPVAVFWFLVRVVPKPSRMMYPCQRATMSLLLAKVVIVLCSATSVVTGLFKRKGMKMVCFCVLVGIIVAEPAELMYYQVRYSVIGNKNSLTLTDISASFPINRVVRVHGDSATNWDFSTGYYWQYVDQSAVDRMVEEGVKNLTDTATEQEAWQSLIPYATGQTVGIQINGNDFWARGNPEGDINTLPHIICAVIKGLKSIGIPESRIHVLEPTSSVPNGNRLFPAHYYNIIHGLYPNVVMLDSDDSTFGGNEELKVTFGTGEQYLSNLLADVDHLILIPIMKAITPDWGITGTIKLMQGVVENPGMLHDYLADVTADNPDVLVYQNPHVINKVRLIVGDGIFGTWTGIHFNGPYGGADTVQPPNTRSDIPNRWITFDNGAPNSLFFAIDPVAIDCVMYDHIFRERNDQNQVPGQSLAPFNEPQLIAGAAAGLGIREHGPPYSNIDYMEIELGEAPPPTYSLTITKTVGGTTDPVPGTYTYPEGTIVSVTAIPDTGFLFDHWELDGVEVGATATIDVTMNADHGLHAVFVTTHVLSVSSSPITDISFTVDGVSHSTPWSSSLTEGSHTIVMPSSVTDAGATYKFKNWEDSSTTRTRAIYLVENKPITAYYEKVTTPPPGPSPSPPPPSPANGTLEVHAYCDSTEINSTVEVVGVGTYTTPFILDLEVETYTLNATYDEQTQTKMAEVMEGAVTQVEFYFADTMKPTAHAGLDQTVNEDTPMKFDGSASSDNIGIVSYTWMFMDMTPQTLTGVNPTYTFTIPGVYTVTLTVRDAAGNYATDTTLITVLDVTAPIADAGDNQAVTEGTPINLSAGDSSDNVGIVSYEWDFGDGTHETGETATHTYTGPGNYTVTLTVKDAAGNSETDSINITVLGDTDKDGTPDITDMDDDGDGMPDAAAPNRWISSAVVPVGIAALVAIAAIATLYITKVKKASSHTSPTRSSST